MTRNLAFIKIVPLLIAGALFFGCQKKTLIQLQTYKTETGWGYLLKKDGKIYIKQDHIPAIEGNYPFISKTDAEKTGRLVLTKLSSRKYPSITPQELDSLNISFPHNSTF